ncbi:hypothetical protein BT96DRAFT_920775 [Gymnopus androsaceus JB14]|uniref:DUF202 domain-containing protein n=1 Tax=Gymnopus androsaceus JB14 TaxID=1447944 RepID=A0A6A4HIF0_9AGAR|nr:hypothetical protein BT96DRAFT_920775 [Gymnopus androsaceus JB14]
MSTPTPRPQNPLAEQPRPDSLLRRSWHLMAERLSPFSAGALASLPNVSRPKDVRYTRRDGIPDVEPANEDGSNIGEGLMPTVRDYHSINNLPSAVRVPKKIATPIKVEGKVWFANERTWISWLNLAVLLGTLALALFNASNHNPIARNFAYAYALISIGVLVYGFALYQRRITMIRKRDPGHFDAIAGPIIVSVLLFVAIAANFIVRVRELQRKNIPIPGSDLVNSLASIVPAGMWSLRDTVGGNTNTSMSMGAI